jgi:hypothetical protein
MSTTYGVIIPSTGETKPIAKRANGGDVFFTDPIAEILPESLDVIAMDNTAQGINTIGHIRKEIEAKRK